MELTALASSVLLLCCAGKCTVGLPAQRDYFAPEKIKLKAMWTLFPKWVHTAVAAVMAVAKA